MPGTPLRAKLLPSRLAEFRIEGCCTAETWKQIPGVTGFGELRKRIGGFWALETDSTEVAKRYKATPREFAERRAIRIPSRRAPLVQAHLNQSQWETSLRLMLSAAIFQFVLTMSSA